MITGALGDIAFEVSHEKIETLDKFKWSGSARWAVHKRHARNALTEFAGLDPDQIAFEVYLSAHLGAAPMQEIAKLWKYEREGTPLALTIGEHAYGKYRWSVTAHKVSAETSDGHGNILSCTVSLSLQEYLKN